jgi:hypothetical protein
VIGLRGAFLKSFELIFLSSFVVVAGCHPTPPAAPPPPPPQVGGDLKVPPPKCETIEEGCVAVAGSKAHLDGPGWTIEPPPQWHYAQGTLIKAEANESLVTATTLDHDAKKPERARREAALAVLVKEMNLVLPKKLSWPKKPDQIVEAGDYQISLYQFESVARAEKKGTLLIFSISPAEEDGLLGAGFVPDDDGTNADQSILVAIRSIGKTPSVEGPTVSDPK